MITNSLFLDVSRKEIKSITVCQGDQNSRVWNVYFSNGGTQLDLKTITSISIYMRKPDGNFIYNPCQIDLDNNCAILTFDEQMCLVSGVGTLQMSMYTYDEINNSLEVLYTFAVKVIISESSIPISDITSSSEFNKLNELIKKAESNYADVIDKVSNSEQNAKQSEINAKQSEDNSNTYANISKSYAVGDTGTRTGENTDNAKYYSLLAKTSATEAKTSETNASKYATSAQTSSNNANNSANTATTKANIATTAANTATTKASEASTSATNAKTSEINAATSETNALNSKNMASTSESNASIYAGNAEKSADNALSSANTATAKAAEALSSANSIKNTETVVKGYADDAKKYAIGDTGSAKYYYEQAKGVSEGFTGALKPMGTFNVLPVLSDAPVGGMYNISTEFTTTSDFKEGTGHIISAGSNIYKTVDGKWDVLAGTPVSGVKGNKEITYRRGNVNITASDIGFEEISSTEPTSQEVGCYWLLDY